jgi:CHRD domain.
MSSITKKSRFTFAAAGLMVGIMATGSGIASAAEVHTTLAGNNEVPAVTTSAKGNGVITVNPDMSLSGSVKTSGVDGTMAHIHQAAAGKNGPVIVPLEKKGANEWVVPAGAKFTDAQYKAYKSGDLYYNVHSDAHKGGEIRGQLKP